MKTNPREILTKREETVVQYNWVICYCFVVSTDSTLCSSCKYATNANTSYNVLSSLQEKTNEIWCHKMKRSNLECQMAARGTKEVSERRGEGRGGEGRRADDDILMRL